MIIAATHQIQADLTQLTDIREFIRDTAAALGTESTAIPDVVLAANEAVTNIIVHGYRDQPATIEIEVGYEADDLIIRLRDQSFIFNPNTVLPPDLTLPLEERPLGGLGVYLTKKLMDQVLHRVTSRGGNELTLVKKNVIRNIS